MRIAIPFANGKLAMHFGHCEEFALIDVDCDKKTILKNERIAAPAHQPELLPRWLAEREAELIIAGGMGSRAQELFAQNQIKVVVGASSETPEKVVAAYLEGTIRFGENICDH